MILIPDPFIKFQPSVDVANHVGVKKQFLCTLISARQSSHIVISCAVVGLNCLKFISSSD